MDVSPLAGILAERLLRYAPYLLTASSLPAGEAVEASLKFARRATGRVGFGYCTNAFHGHYYCALSVTGDGNFRNGSDQLLTHCSEVPFNDLGALEKMLATRQVAAFIVEPIQGKGVTVPDETTCLAFKSSVANTEPCSLPTRSRPVLAALGVSSG